MNTWFGAAAVATAAMLAGTASGQSLTIGVAFEAVSMDPCWDNGSHTQQIGNNVFGPFIQQDHGSTPDACARDILEAGRRPDVGVQGS